MRKLVLVLCVLAILPVAVFAEWGIGGAAFYKSPILLGQPIDTSNVNVNQFSFGGDLRLKLAWFQAEALVLYSAVMSESEYLSGRRRGPGRGDSSPVAWCRTQLVLQHRPEFSGPGRAERKAWRGYQAGTDLGRRLVHHGSEHCQRRECPDQHRVAGCPGPVLVLVFRTDPVGTWRRGGFSSSAAEVQPADVFSNRRDDQEGVPVSEQMKAVRFHEYGGSEKLVQETIPRPSPGPTKC